MSLGASRSCSFVMPWTCWAAQVIFLSVWMYDIQVSESEVWLRDQLAVPI